MFPGGMDIGKMQKMMKQMGIESTEIKAKRVVIEKEDENIIISNPQITLIEMSGQKSFQITGEATTESKLREEDIKMVMEQGGVSRADAEKALKDAGGDIAEAIIKSKSGSE